jgi:hypothetical protein
MLKMSARLLLLSLLVTACGRTAATLDEETQAQLDQASDDATDALTMAGTNTDDIATLDGRVDVLEEASGQSALRADLDALEGTVGEVSTSVDGLNLRVTQIEGSLPVTDGTVAVDDKIAAGFPSTAPVANVEEAMSYINQRIDVQAIDMADLTVDVLAATTSVAENGALVAAHEAAIADLTARLAALEAFQANDLEGAIDARIATTVLPLVARVDTLEAEGGLPSVLGISVATSTGRFEVAAETGAKAATALCQASFVDVPSAHLCSLDEVHRALSLGRIDDPAAIDGVSTWTLPGFTRQHGTVDAFTNADSLATSCYGFMSDAADVATGTRVRVALALPGAGVGGVDIAADAVVVEPNRSCDEVYPVLCCR